MYVCQPKTQKSLNFFIKINQNLIQENASKNTIIKFLAEKHTFDNSNSKSTVSEEFTTVHSKFRQKKSRLKKH